MSLIYVKSVNVNYVYEGFAYFFRFSMNPTEFHLDLNAQKNFSFLKYLVYIFISCDQN